MTEAAREGRRPAWLRRPARPEPAPLAEELPTTPDAIEIALEAEVSGDRPGGVARAVLDRQAVLLEAQIDELRRKRWRDYLVTFAFIAILVGLGAFVLGAARANGVVVEPFDAPPDLAASGLNAQTVASAVQDAVATIQEANTEAATQRNIANAWTNDIKVELPSTGISIGDADRMLRAGLGHETHIGGSLLVQPDGTLALTVRATGVPPRTFTGTRTELSRLATEAAEYVYGRFEPRLFAAYLLRKQRDAIPFIEEAYTRGPEEVRSGLASSWSTALGRTDDATGTVEKARLAISLDPYNWNAWNNLLGALYDTDGEEAVVRTGKQVEAQLAAAPDDRKPIGSINPRTNVQPLLQDWTTFIADTEADVAANGGRGSFITTDSNGSIAEAEARRHDWVAARRKLTATTASPTRIAIAHLVFGYRAIESGHPERAVPAMERVRAILVSDPDAAYTFPSGLCWLGLAYGLSGRVADAARVFATAGKWNECDVFAADVAEYRGDRARADALYAQAIRRSPSMPLSYQHYGQARLARGDVAGAQSMFAKAAETGPHWADPRKALGDVAMRRGDWTAAKDYYAQATPFAPGWSALARARAEAERQVAALPWWRRWFA